MIRYLVAPLLTTACAAACNYPTDPPGFNPDGPWPAPPSVTAPASPPQVGRLATVTHVVDGDTIDVAGTFTAGKERVRLLTVDSPELRSNTRADDAECGAEAARDALAGLLPPGTQVVLRQLSGEDAQDGFERTLANVYVADATGPVNVSLWLVQNGHARVYREYPTVETDEAIRLETQARERRVGMWGMCPGGAK